MKKVISLGLVFIMLLSLCACSGNQGKDLNKEDVNDTQSFSEYTKDDLLKNPIEATMIDLQNAVYDNRVKAKQTYCNTPVIVIGKAISIESDHVVLCDSQVCLNAYMTEDELGLISAQKNVKIVGIISDIQDLELTWGGSTFTEPHYIMDIAFLVDAG